MYNSKKLVGNTLVEIAQKRTGQLLSVDERDRLREFADQIEPYSNTDEEECDAETLAIMREELIERLGADIRMVVVGYVDIKNEPFPYIVKKNLPLMRESHSRILIADCDIFQDAIRYAERDLFGDGLRLFDNIEEYRSFFDQYTADPSVFSWNSIKSVIPEKYKSSIEELF